MPETRTGNNRLVLVLALAVLLATSLAAGATAQLDASGVADTKYTPDTKATTAWAQVGGAEFGVDKFPEGSPTPVEAELYTVDFENDTHGFAGGMQCKVPPEPGTTGAALESYLADCGGSGREPVIYEYLQTETEESWRPVLPPSGEGYVGAISFMPDGRALAVGGDGAYPKRESTTGDVAGHARAWIYEDGFWAEVDESRMLDGMRGMTALGMSPRVGDCVDDRSECGLAGAYRQVWLWKDGRFTQGFFGVDANPENAPGEPAGGPAVFRHRVRQIGFVPAFGVQKLTKAVGVTSGCCDVVGPEETPRAPDNTPRVLVFDGDSLSVKEVVASQRGPDSLYGLVLDTTENMSLVASPGGASAQGSPAADVDSPVGEASARVYGGATRPRPTDSDVTPLGFTPTQTISTVRLTAGAGITRGAAANLDWAVGSLADSGQGLVYSPDGDNAGNTLGSDTVPNPPNVLSCPGGGWPWKGPFVPRVVDDAGNADYPDLQCQPYDAAGLQDQTRSKGFFHLPSYGLNAISFTDETEAVAWAVGDRGAIVRLGGVGTSSTTTADDKPAKVGPATRATFGGGDVYAAFRPLPSDGGTAPVPSLASNGTDESRPRLVAGGAPNPTIPGHRNYPPEDVSSMAMSRDGSEGWAVGSGYPAFTASSLPQAGPVPTLYHYDGSRWSRCDIRGIDGLLPPDPACAGMQRLFGAGPGGDNVILTHVVRVPTENDGEDPSDDDEFEAVAIGTTYFADGLPSAPVFARYEHGEWYVDETAQQQLGAFGLHTPRSVAFTAPDDGWITARMRQSPTLFHWDGERWWDCSTTQARASACGDANQLLPLDTAGESEAVVTAAGRRIYIATNRIPGSTSSTGAGAALSGKQPAILYRDPGGAWTAEGEGYDPGCVPQAGAPGCATAETQPDPSTLGQVISIAVAPGPGGYVGWAVGRFGTTPAEQTAEDNAGDAADGASPGSVKRSYYLLRLRDGRWTPHTADDAALDYLPRALGTPLGARPVILDPQTGAAAIYKQDASSPTGPALLVFEPSRGAAGRWRVLETPFSMRAGSGVDSIGYVHGVASDGSGGAWIASKQRHSSSEERDAVHMWHYTATAPKPVFEEAPHPVRESITGGAAGPDGSFWVTTNSSFVYRYDRLTGWERLRVPGWDPGRVITRTSEANAVAIGPDGEGLVVGKNGRIAEVSPLGVQLDAATGKTCGDPPCGTARNLRAVAVAPDGSALAGGDASELLYRPAGEPFRRLDFGGSEVASITAISMPSPDRAWIANNLGQLFAGERGADGWTFFVENRAPGGKLLSLDENDKPLAINGLGIDESGEGYAVGARGLILERRGDGGWQRIKTGFLDHLRSVTLAPQGRGGGALIGGDMGLILTLEDGDFRVAREADLYDPLNFGNGSSLAANVLAVALVPGIEKGQTEAWAVQQVPASSRQSRTGPGAVLHYTSDRDYSLLQPGARVDPLPDVPAPRPGEISFAAFGRSDCQGVGGQCPEGHVANLFNEVVSRRVTGEVLDRSDEPGGPQFAVFTGDVGRAAGKEGANGNANKPFDKSWVHRRWTELVADRFADEEVPLFGAVGLNDLDRTAACTAPSACPVDSKSHAAGSGLASGWRRAMVDMAPPWGAEGSEWPQPSGEGTRFESVEDQATVSEQAGQAHTHYAVDALRDGKKIARLIFLDNSMRTLASSEPNQNPVEQGGQEEWLKRTLSGVDTAAGEQAIVVMNTPTYSYQAGDPTSWAGDATVLERTLMEHGVKMVVSGRLGWNGRYWATSPAVHHPCPGGGYMHDDKAPGPEASPCDEQTAAAQDPANAIGERVSEALTDLGAPAPPGEDDLPPLPVDDAAASAGLQGLLPMVVASSAGGTFGPDGTEGGPASDGYWHGYTVVRLDASGDPRKTIVEQRPVFDWISMTASTHVLKPRQRMTLRGEGREPVGMDVPPRYDAINSFAITHRYDLVMADERNPSLPKTDAEGQYVKVPESVGSIEPDTGVVRAGGGRQERTYAVAILSVGDKAASWPIAFEPAKSFKPRPVPVTPPSVVNTPSHPVPARPLPPPPVVLNSPPSPTPPPTPPANIPQVTLPTLKLPAPPGLPNIPGLPGATPTPTPPPPPAPPAPPGGAGALPLSLQAPLNAISVVTTVIPPSPPPVNPAPPGGSAARKEARQRQAATAKSEEGGGEGAGEGQSSGESGGAEMTRRDRTRPAPSHDIRRRDDTRYSFTAVSHTEQASAWSRGALYGGMTIASALVLALGWGIAGPRSRRRHPPQPAPVRERLRQ